MESKHTPDPVVKDWELVENDEEGLHVMEGNLLVCEQINGVPLGRLIAASPDLLAACKLFLNVDRDRLLHGPLLHDIVAAAVAKATKGTT